MTGLPAWRKFAVLGVFALSVCAAHAVDVNGRIRGTVTDPAGAVIPNVTVVATNQNTGVKFTTTSNGSGEYIFQQVPIGTYTISASAPGFKGFSATGITLNIDQEYVEPVKLDVGNTSETVTVEANAVQVNLTDMQLGNIVDTHQITELPLIGRAFTALEQILPGVQASNDRFGSFSVNGSQTQQSAYIINGADSNDLPLNTIGIQPNIDALQQFNLVTGPLNAEYDRNSGAIVSTAIKQGTNSFHGDIFEFYRDTFLNTRNYFQKFPDQRSGVVPATPKFHQNIFGGTLGGPILRDKLFFFGAYQGSRQIVPQATQTNTAFSTANLTTGNFSNLLDPTVTARPCDPALVKTTMCNPSDGIFTSNLIPSTIKIANCTGVNETFAQCAFDNKGIFPVQSFNPISTKLVNTFFPATPNGGTVSFTPVSTTKQDQEIGKFDFNPTSRDQFYALGIHQTSDTLNVIPFTGASVTGFGDKNVTKIYQFSAGYTRQVSSSLVNDLSAHYTRFNFDFVEPQTNATPASFGFAITSQNPSSVQLPFINVASTNATGASFSLGSSTNGPQPRIDQVYQLDDNISKNFGHHNVKVGYDGRRYNVANPFFNNINGSFSFNDGHNDTTGDAGLDFLLGAPASYAQGSGAYIKAYAFLNYFFAQDTWKVTDSLTISYGLGYQIDTPLHNQQYAGKGVTCFIPNQQSKLFSSAPKGLSFPGDPGCNDASGATTKYTDFGPRIGFAFAPDFGFLSAGKNKKLSIRGGYGIYYNRTEEETSLQNLGDPPYGINSLGASDYGASNPGFANPYQDLNTGKVYQNKFPFTPPAPGSTPDFSQYFPFSLSQYDPKFRSPYSENFQLTVEREFPSQTVARVSYVGTLGRHNQIILEGNPITKAGHDACLADAGCVANRNLQSFFYPTHTQFGYADPNNNGGLNDFASVGLITTSGSSSYHSLQASVDKGLTHGLQLQASYTLSHSLDNASSFEGAGFGGQRGYNQYDTSRNYGSSNFDARHRFVLAPIYTVPFKHGGNPFNPINLALSGWQVSAISTFATGFPFDIAYGGFSSSNSLYCSRFVTFYACPDAPNQTGPLVRGDLRTRTSAGGSTLNNRTTYFTRTNFTAEAIGTFGNEGRNVYHGPGILNTDMVLAKNFILSSDNKRSLQLRLTSSNVFNHTQFANPVSNYLSSSFGQVTAAAAGRQTQLAAKIYF